MRNDSVKWGTQIYKQITKIQNYSSKQKKRSLPEINKKYEKRVPQSQREETVSRGKKKRGG